MGPAAYCEPWWKAGVPLSWQHAILRLVSLAQVAWHQARNCCLWGALSVLFMASCNFHCACTAAYSCVDWLSSQVGSQHLVVMALLQLNSADGAWLCPMCMCRTCADHCLRGLARLGHCLQAVLLCCCPFIPALAMLFLDCNVCKRNGIHNKIEVS